jgi:hypothetical protein
MRSTRCENTVARDDYASITDELFGCSKWRLDQRTAASEAGGACRLEDGGTAQIWPQRLLKN